ncbi:hypothetical protein CRUP_004046 [Coryphaenoides rupestris]|nr:hypothetical protein CRUP_004046 [Coryphaenoides rupestris]
MEQSLSPDMDKEPRERKKIHFADPSSAPTNLDPRQVEMIRRRRPTPATLFRVADQGSPDDDQSTHQWVVGENGVLKPKRVNPNVYQPPSLRATLFRVADQGSPDDDQSTHQWVVGENGVLKPKRVNPNVYQPPSLRAVQKMAEAHMQHLGISTPMENPYEGDEYEDGGTSSFSTAPGPHGAVGSDQSEAGSRVSAISRQVQPEEDEEEEGEEEEEEEEEEETVGKSEGSPEPAAQSNRGI